jgi:hypothetical protein
LYLDGYHWPQGKRPLGRPKHRWEVNIKMVLREIGGGGMDWIHLACELGNESPGSIKYLEIIE